MITPRAVALFLGAWKARKKSVFSDFAPTYTANVYRDLRGPCGEIGVRGFRIAGFTCISAFSINSVGVPFMDFAGKL